MLYLIVISILVFLGVGLGVKFYLDSQRGPARITWFEFAIGGIAGVSLIPMIVYGGYMSAQAGQRVYNEYINGWEVAAVAHPIQCTRDGPCRYTYNCDPYIVRVSYSCGTSKEPKTCYRNETRYHDCPYVKVETTYVVNTTIGNFTIDSHRFPVNPDQHRWRSSTSVPQSVIAQAGVGEPDVWTAAKKRLASGYPGPVTNRRTYENFILASDRTILLQYSSKIAEYEKAGLLPKISTGIEFPYHAPKAYFVGLRIGGAPWQAAVEYLNAALGSSLQGDLHLVLVNSSVITNKDEYALALKAYWQDNTRFGRDCLSKNGILVVVGTDGTKVDWARAFTGMPEGNESMIVALEKRLPGTALVPDLVVGSTKLRIPPAGPSATVIGTGVIESILFDSETKFSRIKMGGKDGDVGYAYLARETPVPGWHQFFIVFFAAFFSCGAWLICGIYTKGRY